MNDEGLAGAFKELQAEFHVQLREKKDDKQEVKIDGKKYEAIIEEVESDEVIAEGGQGDSGGARIVVARALLRNKPAEDCVICVWGRTFDMLSAVNTNNVTWTIIAGNKATGDE